MRRSFMHLCCVAPHGERGLKYYFLFPFLGLRRVAPHGERGLKLPDLRRASRRSMCRSPRGAWIEIPQLPQPADLTPSVAPHGERGLKYGGQPEGPEPYSCRSPRGAWIEIRTTRSTTYRKRVSLPTGSVD